MTPKTAGIQGGEGRGALRDRTAYGANRTLGWLNLDEVAGCWRTRGKMPTMLNTAPDTELRSMRSRDKRKRMLMCCDGRACLHDVALSWGDDDGSASSVPK